MGFKEAIQEYGKEITASFVCGGVTYGDDSIISVNPHFEGSLLKSVMKCVDIEMERGSIAEIPTITGSAVAGNAIVGVGDVSDASFIRNLKIGVKGQNDADYFYKEYGTYIVKEKKIDEEKGTGILECYDLMLMSMIPYDLEFDFNENPNLCVIDLLDAICDRFGWGKGYKEIPFHGQGRLIKYSQYDASYTFRDVLDDISELACGMLGFVGDDLCVILPRNTGEVIDSSNLKTLKIGDVYGPVNSLVLARTPQEDNVYRQDDESIAANGRTEIRIENNLLIDPDRDSVIDIMASNIFLFYTQFTLYELESFGIGYLNFGDIFTIQTPDGELHRTIMLCDDLKITQGMTETSRLEAPEVTETDYKAASESDRVLNKTILKVDKQAQEITALVTRTENIESSVGGLDAKVTKMAEVMVDSDSVDIKISTAIEDIDSVTTSTGYTFDEEGLKISKSGESMENLLDNTGMYVKRDGEAILTANNEGVSAINLTSRQFLIVGDNSRFENYDNGTDSKRTACFYIGG